MIFRLGKLLLFFCLQNLSFASQLTPPGPPKDTENSLVRPSEKPQLEVYEQEMAHVHAGCPENSLCSAELGKLYGKWREAFKLSFQGSEGKSESSHRTPSTLQHIYEKLGWPITFFARSTWGDSALFVGWQSDCSYHQIKQPRPAQTAGLQSPHLTTKPFLRLQGLLKSTGPTQVTFTSPQKSLSLSPPLQDYAFDRVEVWKISAQKTLGQPQIFFIPLEEKNFLYTSAGLEFLMEQEDHFFKLTIDFNHKWTFGKISLNEILQFKKNLESNQRLTCPEEQRELSPEEKPFFSGVECFETKTPAGTLLIRRRVSCF